jgi:hypothetical protein
MAADDTIVTTIAHHWYPIMAKGFGAKQAEQIGYILDLMPDLNVYAAKFSFKLPGEKDSDDIFIGLISTLADAQIWKTQKLAKQAIDQYYSDAILQQLDEAEAVRVNIKRLERSGDNELKTEVVETLHFYREQP